MPFIKHIVNCSSVSIVGLDKNTGKTECLNYILRRTKDVASQIAVTSIGMDGERTDIVTGTSKPEIELYPGTVFITAEKLYRQRKLDAEVLDISSGTTALGRLITARVKTTGKIMIAGPQDSLWLNEVLASLHKYNVQTTLVDGAVSRKSHSSPAVCQAMILCTGAALSANISKLITQTKFVYELSQLPQADICTATSVELLQLPMGMYSIDELQAIRKLDIASAFILDEHLEKLTRCTNTLFVTGVVNERLLQLLSAKKDATIKLIVKDFTRLFVQPASLRCFVASGNSIEVLSKPKVLAVCLNPTAPNGYCLNSKEVCTQLSEVLKIPVYDIKKMESYDAVLT